MKTIDQAGDLRGKKVLLRTDLDVPVGTDGVIQEEFRIVRQREAVHYLLDHGARVVMVAHISAVPSFEQLVPQLRHILGAEMRFCKDLKDMRSFLADDGSLALLENIRANPGEETNDQTFAAELVAGFDLYVNNNFAVCHREHASVVGAPGLLPSYAGPIIRDETEQLTRAIQAPARGKVVYIGGAKVSTKMPVIKYLLDKAEVIAVGGVIANEIGAPADPRIQVATDFVMDEGVARDIGPKTAEAFAALARDAEMIVWNGPMGKFEDERFVAGTKVLAQAIADSDAFSVIGGGDTVSAVDQLGLLDKMNFVSTGGGAMLAFLAGEQLPGLKALGYYNDETH